MACAKRRTTGHCGHHQCHHPEESGYECVDLFPSVIGGEVLHFCEAGLNCVTRCAHSYKEKDAAAIDEGYTICRREGLR